MRDIPGFEEKYAVTSCGKVWSYKHKKFLKPKIVKGYSRVDLVDKDNKVHQCNIHRLMALTYIPNPDSLPCVNHKDENRTNNCVGNLEWCTYQYNNTYGTRLEKVSKKNKANKAWKHGVEALKKAVLCVETGVVYESAMEEARQLGISHGHIGSCCNGKRKTTGGYHWKYAEVSV